MMISFGTISHLPKSPGEHTAIVFFPPWRQQFTQGFLIFHAQARKSWVLLVQWLEESNEEEADTESERGLCKQLSVYHLGFLTEASLCAKLS